MNDDVTEPDDDIDPESDALDDAVIAADDTGMLAGERLITIAETEEPILEMGRDDGPGGNADSK
jgi:hypothetical protein